MRSTSAFDSTSEWLAAGRQEVARIYSNPAIAGALTNRPTVDPANDSHANVIDGLRGAIEEQIGALNEIRGQTRVHDGQP